MTTRPCIICGEPFTPSRSHVVTCSLPCRAERHRAVQKARDAKPQHVARRRAYMGSKPWQPIECSRCGVTFTPHHRLQVYCSRECKGRASDARYAERERERNGKPKTKREPEPKRQPRLTCLQCSGPIANPAPQRKYCSPKCRKAYCIAKQVDDDTPLDFDGEYLVKDLEDAPRRERVARLFDRLENGGVFEHFAPLTYVNPADRRYGR